MQSNKKIREKIAYMTQSCQMREKGQGKMIKQRE